MSLERYTVTIQDTAEYFGYSTDKVIIPPKIWYKSLSELPEREENEYLWGMRVYVMPPFDGSSIAITPYPILVTEDSL